MKSLSCLRPWARHISGCSTETVHSISELKVASDDKHLLNNKGDTRDGNRQCFDRLPLPQCTVCTSCNIHCSLLLSVCSVSLWTWREVGGSSSLCLLGRQTVGYQLVPALLYFPLFPVFLVHSLTETLYLFCLFPLLVLLSSSLPSPPSFCDSRSV